LPAETSGLESVLRAMLERFGTEAPIELIVEGPEPPLTVHTEYHVMRIAQEAVANALRHAPGSPIRVIVRFPSGKILLRVTDGGPGFDAAAVGHTAGLSGMRQRAAMLKGE